MLNFDFKFMKRCCLKNYPSGLCGSGKCECEDVCNNILKDNILPKDFDIKLELEEKSYIWSVVEEDGYCYSESGTAYDILDAADKAVEYSPKFVKSLIVMETQKYGKT